MSNSHNFSFFPAKIDEKIEFPIRVNKNSLFLPRIHEFSRIIRVFVAKEQIQGIYRENIDANPDIPKFIVRV